MRRTILTALAACLLLPPAARAEFRPLETGVQAVYADGERFAVLQRADGSLAVLDDRGPAPALTPPACADPARPARLMGVGGGMALFECGDQQDRGASDPRIVDLATRTVSPVPGLDELRRRYETYEPFVVVVGRHWAAVTLDNQLGSFSVYLNWRTGAVIEDRVTEERRSVIPDLDLAGLDRRLCRGVRRRIVTVDYYRGSGETTVFDPLEYRDRHALDGRRLRRCGARRAVKVPAGARLGAGRVTWRKGDRLVVRSLRSGRRAQLRLPDADPATSWLETGDRFLAVRGDRAWLARAPR